MQIQVDLGKKDISMLKEALERMRSTAKTSVDDPKNRGIVTIRDIETKHQRGLANQGFKILEEA